MELEANLVSNYVTNIERCRKNVKILTIDKIAKALDVETIELFKKRKKYLYKKRIDETKE